MLQLRSVLQLVPRLSQALSGADSELLRAVRTTCGDACFVDMGDRINQVCVCVWVGVGGWVGQTNCVCLWVCVRARGCVHAVCV